MEEIAGEIASEVTTGTTGLNGVRKSEDSEWSKFTVPVNFAINKGKTVVNELEARGSEHSYILEYADDVEIVPGTNILMPRTIMVKTHARSSNGHGGGSGKMSVKAVFYYVRYRN